MNKKPIGVFDSGLGGLTVMKKIAEKLPNEDLIYLGDLAHLPYGNKSEKTVKSLVIKNSTWLVNQGVKAIVIACNTATAIAYKDVVNMFNVPIIGVVTPGCRTAVKNSINKQICVIATKAAVKSHAYLNGIKELEPSANVIEKDCPLFVPMIEEGFLDHHALDLVIDEYLNEIAKKVDSLVLGCTHYPLLKTRLEKKYPHLKVLDPGDAVADELKVVLENMNIANDSQNVGEKRIYATDLTETFQELSKKILGIETKINLIEPL